MEKCKIIKINGHFYIQISELIAESIKGQNYSLRIENNEIILTNKKNSNKYWERAATESKREVFMNTVRPLLKEQLGFNYSEIACEEKAILLCQKYYEAKDNGEEYKGPYLI